MQAQQATKPAPDVGQPEAERPGMPQQDPLPGRPSFVGIAMAVSDTRAEALAATLHAVIGADRDEVSPAPAPVEGLSELAHSLVDAVRRVASVIGRFVENAQALHEFVGDEQPPADAMARALWLRQRRNTGPVVRRRAHSELWPAATAAAPS